MQNFRIFKDYKPREMRSVKGRYLINLYHIRFENFDEYIKNSKFEPVKFIIPTFFYSEFEDKDFSELLEIKYKVPCELTDVSERDPVRILSVFLCFTKDRPNDPIIIHKPYEVEDWFSHYASSTDTDY
jgi:hypothetical protein